METRPAFAADAAVSALSALGEPNRLAIFRLLVATGPDGLVVGQIAERLAIAPATLSFHLKTLLVAGLVTATREQRFIRYCADFAAMNGLVAYLTENCCGGHPERCAPECRPAASTPGIIDAA